MSLPRVTGPAHGTVVGEGPMVRAGLSQLVFSDGGIGVGVTRLAVNNVQWSATTTIGEDHHVVYSYAPISVSFEGAGDYVVTPNEVVCQPPGQVYQRNELYSGEELSVFAAVSPAVSHLAGLGQLTSRTQLRVASLPAELSLKVWQLAHELLGQPSARRLDLEYAERAATLVAATIGASATPDSTAGPVSPLTLKAHRSLVNATREHLATSYADPALPLARLAADVGASPYHLSRVFRAVTGHSIHQYRMQLRLRAVLAGLASRQPITDLAMSCGFASDAWEAERLMAGTPGSASRPALSRWADFLRKPSAEAWYRAHNSSVVAGYLEHRHLSAAELPVERFFMDVALGRVLYAHALVARPRPTAGRRPPDRRSSLAGR